MKWVSNHPETSKKLRAADRKFDRTMKEISKQSLLLKDKILAIRAAKDLRTKTYQDIYDDLKESNHG